MRGRSVWAWAAAAWLLGIVLGCGGSGTESVPEVETPPPGHPSGASDEEVEMMRWLATDGHRLNTLEQDACFPLRQCTNFSAPGENGAPVNPALAARCIQDRLAACQVASGELRATQIPEPFTAAFRDLADSAAWSVCEAQAALALIEARPRVVRELALMRDRVSPAMREHVRGWEPLSGWTGQHERDEAGQRYSEAILECARAHPGALRGEWSSTSTWLRARFSCEMAGGCCTVDRVAALLERGLEPGPPTPCGVD